MVAVESEELLSPAPPGSGGASVMSSVMFGRDITRDQLMTFTTRINQEQCNSKCCVFFSMFTQHPAFILGMVVIAEVSVIIWLFQKDCFDDAHANCYTVCTSGWAFSSVWDKHGTNCDELMGCEAAEWIEYEDEWKAEGRDIEEVYEGYCRDVVNATFLKKNELRDALSDACGCDKICYQMIWVFNWLIVGHLCCTFLNGLNKFERPKWTMLICSPQFSNILIFILVLACFLTFATFSVVFRNVKLLLAWIFPLTVLTTFELLVQIPLMGDALVYYNKCRCLMKLCYKLGEDPPKKTRCCCFTKGKKNPSRQSTVGFIESPESLEAGALEKLSHEYNQAVRLSRLRSTKTEVEPTNTRNEMEMTEVAATSARNRTKSDLVDNPEKSYYPSLQTEEEKRAGSMSSIDIAGGALEQDGSAPDIERH